MDNTRDVTQNRQADVDEEIRIAAPLEEDTERREDDREDDLTNVARDGHRSATGDTRISYQP